MSDAGNDRLTARTPLLIAASRSGEVIRHQAVSRHREAPRDHGANCVDLVGAHCRRADLDLMDASCRKRLSDLKFFRHRESNAGCLLAVAQGRIVEKDLTAHEWSPVLPALRPGPH